MSDDAANLKKTPLNGVEHELGGKMVDFGGWELPVQFSRHPRRARGRARACRALRRLAHGRADGQRSRGARRCCSAPRATTFRSSRTAARSTTGCSIRPRGFVDDILIYQNAPDDYFVVVNASNTRQGLTSGSPTPRKGWTSKSATSAPTTRSSRCRGPRPSGCCSR